MMSSDSIGVTFTKGDIFYQELKRRAQQYFIKTKKPMRSAPSIYIKSALIAVWAAGSYGTLLFASLNWWQGFALTISLSFALAAAAFNIQHDANHGAYSKNKIVNEVMGFVIDLIGGSSYVWKFKHNNFHHNHPNIAGIDEDIDLWPWARLAPSQPSFWFHRYQHIYVWFLYTFLIFEWQFFDIKCFSKAEVGGRKIRKPNGVNFVVFLLGKLSFVSWAIIWPSFQHPIWIVAIYLYIYASIFGVVLSLTFQLAHCVEGADFLTLPKFTTKLKRSWARHQVESTVNFSPNNPILYWYLGGLNFQIEHHLFPKICHIHYPALAEITKEVCIEFGVRYQIHENIFKGIMSHFRWLRKMAFPIQTEDSPLSN